MRRKQERRRLLRDKLVAGQVSPSERREMAQIDAQLEQRPQQPERSMPSQLGDILRAAEDYPRERYGLDPIVLWPRLYPQLSEPLCGALGAAHVACQR